jgi:hypothetical protein
LGKKKTCGVWALSLAGIKTPGSRSLAETTKKDREFRAAINRCDLCSCRLEDCPDNIEYQIDVLDEINNSYLDEYDRHEPWLLLCDYCNKEYLIPGYPLH